MRTFPLLFVLLAVSLTAAAYQSSGAKIGAATHGTTFRPHVPKVSESWMQTVSVQSAPDTVVPIPFLSRRRITTGDPAFDRVQNPVAHSGSFDATSGAYPFVDFPLSFDGPNEGDSGGSYPPDGAIAVSPNYIVAAINSVVGIYDKSGAEPVPIQQMSSFFSSFGYTGQYADPRVLYDSVSQRFIIVDDFVGYSPFINYNVSSSHILVAVSQSSDPTGSWDKFSFTTWGTDPATGASTWADYPAAALDSKALYIATDQYDTCNLLDSASCNYSDSWVQVISLSDLYARSSSPSVTIFNDIKAASGALATAIQPATIVGNSSQEYLAAAFFSQDATINSGAVLNLFSISTSGTPTLIPLDLTVPQYTLPPNATQPGTSIPIVTDDFRLINAVWVNGVLWCAQNVASDTGNAAVVRWYSIALPSLTQASLTDSGTIIGSGNAYYPAFGAEPDGQVVVVFGTSSTSQFASAAYSGRSLTDGAGEMRAPIIYRAGLAMYTDTKATDSNGNPIYRWGDYSGIAVDPTDGSVWGLVEYSKGPDPQYGTAIIHMASAPSLVATPSSLKFSDEHAGSSTPPLSLQLSNQGSEAVVLSTVSLTGEDPTSFSMSSDGCSGMSLVAGTNCSLSISFLPTTTGAKGAELLIPQTIGGQPQGAVVIPIRGNAISNAVVSLMPTTLTFPSQAEGTTSSPEPITFTNTGTGPLGALVIKTSGTFSETDNCGNQVGAGATCEIDVTFAPTSSGTLAGMLTITDDAEGSPQTVALSGTGTAPQVSFSPTKINFGPVNVGTASAAQSITLTNSGSAPLTISTINTTDWQFSETDDCPHFFPSLSVGGNCTIDIAFEPLSQGTSSASLQVNDDAPGSPQTVSLSGQGGQTAISLSTNSLSFGDQNVGTTSPIRSVNVTNTGQAPLVVTGVSITGTNSGDFKGPSNCIGTLAPTTGCSIGVTFTPSSTSSRTAILSVSDNAPNSPQTVNLSGTGVRPAVDLSPSSLTFGNEGVGVTSASQTIIVENTGQTALNFASISVTGSNASDFGIVSAKTSCSTGSQLNPGSSCNVAVTFTPNASGNRAAILSIADDAPNTPQLVTVFGTGTGPVVSLSPSNLSFGNENVGSTSAFQTISIENTGQSGLNIASISVTGSNASDFGIVSANTSCSTGRQLSSGSSCNVVVSFTPSASGTRNANLAITDNAPGIPHLVSLSGNGQDFTLAVASGTSGAATVTPGGTATYVVNVSPAGGFTQVVSMACSGAPQESNCAVSPTSVFLNGSSSTTVTVTVTTASGAPRANKSLPPNTSSIIMRRFTTLALVVLLPLWTVSRRKKNLLQWYSSMMVVLFAAFLLSSCSSNGNGNGGTPSSAGTPAGTYTVSVAGTSGRLNHTVSLTLTVN